MTAQGFPGSDVACVCTHSQRDHDPDCMAVIGVDAFCGCSGFRVPRGHMDAAMRAQVRKALDDDWMPDWTRDARCRSAKLKGGIGPNTPGQPHPDAFMDDVADTEDLRLPESSVLDFMRDACLPCPVRRQCLSYAYNEVDRKRASGVFGGVPGRIRDRDPIEAANAWFLREAAKRGWTEPSSLLDAAL